MPVTEKSGLLKYKDKTGNLYIMLPITNTDNVDGLDEMIDEAKIVGTAVAATSTDGVAYTATVPGITALTAGDSFVMIPDKLSTSRSTTLNVNNLGAKNLRVRVSGYSGTTSSPMTTNWLAPNKPVRVTYDGTWWIAEVVLPSAQQLYGNVKAEEVTYSNTNSGMTAGDVQSAIDELAGGKTSTQVLTTDEYNALTDKNENVLYMLSDAEDEDNAVRFVECPAKTTLPYYALWRSVCYGDGKFVTVSDRSKVAAYFTDDVDWTQTTLPAIIYWNSVCYGNGKFVAVAYNDNVAAYSTDGVNWTQTTMPTSVNWYSVCYGNGKFVAVAYNGNVAAYSTDGINWTQTTLPVSEYWYSVCYGNGKFVAVTNGMNIAAYSTDGVNWTQTTMPTSVNWYSVCYGNGKFVAVANSNIAAYSTDGVNWTQTTMPTSVNWYSVCYGNGKFVAVADGGYGSNIAAYSTDGINWTQTTLPVSEYWYSVCYGNGKFVAVTYNGNVAAYSTDGINWFKTFTPPPVLKNSSGEDISDDVKNALDISADDVGADTKGSAAQALTDAKAYADEAIAAIPTPDVSGQIATHNSDSSAHQDIRTALENVSIEATNADNVVLTDAKAYADVADQGLLADANLYADSAVNNLETTMRSFVDQQVQTKAPAYTYGTSDLTAGTSSLATGVLYFVYE